METLLVTHKQEGLQRTFMYSAITDVVRYSYWRSYHWKWRESSL